MSNRAALDPQGLLEIIFSELHQQFDAQELNLARSIRTRIMADNPEHTVESQIMEYYRFLYLRLPKKLWILCLGKHAVNNGDNYVADLSALRIFDSRLQAVETIPEMKARLRSSRTFFYSLLCGRRDNVLCFPLESTHYEAMQALSDTDPNSFWVEPHLHHHDFGDGVFREPRSMPGFYEASATEHFVNLVVNVLTMSDQD